MAAETAYLDAKEVNVAGERLVKKSQAAVKLGVSSRTVDRLAQKGILEKVFVGSSPRFRLSELNKIVEKGS